LSASKRGLRSIGSPSLSRTVQRVAHARGVPPEQIAALLEQHITSRSLGIFGEPRINVLILNLALQRDYPRPD
jgi:potassium-transporting ATPase KdpC subunit